MLIILQVFIQNNEAKKNYTISVTSDSECVKCAWYNLKFSHRLYIRNYSSSSCTRIRFIFAFPTPLDLLLPSLVRCLNCTASPRLVIPDSFNWAVVMRICNYLNNKKDSPQFCRYIYIYFHAKFHVTICSGSLLTGINPVDKYRTPSAVMFLFYVL